MKKKTWMALLAVLLLIAGSVSIRILHLDDNTTYIPFSGRIFDFEVHKVSDLFLQNGTTGFSTSEEAMEEIADMLNSLRSRFWFPEIRLFQTGGWGYRAALIDGSTQKSFYFNDQPIPYISVNGIIYILSVEQAAALTDFVN